MLAVETVKGAKKLPQEWANMTFLVVETVPCIKNLEVNSNFFQLFIVLMNLHMLKNVFSR